MNKYDPDESITCPKCGRTYVAEVMSVRWYGKHSHAFLDEIQPCMLLCCLCGWRDVRRPLDYEGDD